MRKDETVPTRRSRSRKRKRRGEQTDARRTRKKGSTVEDVTFLLEFLLLGVPRLEPSLEITDLLGVSDEVPGALRSVSVVPQLVVYQSELHWLL